MIRLISGDPAGVPESHMPKQETDSAALRNPSWTHAALAAGSAEGEPVFGVRGLRRLERRRSQLLLITGLVVLALLFGLLSEALPTFGLSPELPSFLSLPTVLYGSLALLIVLFLSYVGLSDRRNKAVLLRLWDQGVRMQSVTGRLEELQALQEIFAALGSTVHFRPTVERVLDSVFDITHARYASLMMATTVIQRCGEGFEANRQLVEMVSSVAGRVQEEGNTISLRKGDEYGASNSQGERRFARYPLLSIPLRVEKKTIGVLNIMPPAGTNSFAEDTKRLLHIFGDQVAMAIQKARLVQRLEVSIKELEEAQEKMVQAGKLAAVGELAAGVAHEINNPLGGILGLSQHILERARRNELDPDWMMSRLELVEREANRAKQIVRNLLDFSRSPSAEFSIVDLVAVLRDTLGMLEHQLNLSNITVEKCFEDPLPPIIGNANQLQQVFTNIITNAQKAIGTDGIITISARTQEVEGGEMVRLSFSDTGCGIPGDKLDRIFEPFFTTREGDKGTGLGLSVSYRIVKDHQGELFVEESACGQGTTFTIVLPVPAKEEAGALFAPVGTEEER